MLEIIDLLKSKNYTYKKLNNHSKIKTFSQIKETWLTNMNEERREKLKTEKNRLDVEFGKKKIVTCEIVFD